MSSDIVTSASQIPNAPFYVTMTDKFMSDWGIAEGKINKLCFVCESYAEAMIVWENAKVRGDMKYVNIRSSKPNVTKRFELWQAKTKDGGYRWWYKPRHFVNDRTRYGLLID